MEQIEQKGREGKGTRAKIRIITSNDREINRWVWITYGCSCLTTSTNANPLLTFMDETSVTMRQGNLCTDIHYCMMIWRYDDMILMMCTDDRWQLTWWRALFCLYGQLRRWNFCDRMCVTRLIISTCHCQLTFERRAYIYWLDMAMCAAIYVCTTITNTITIPREWTFPSLLQLDSQLCLRIDIETDTVLSCCEWLVE